MRVQTQLRITAGLAMALVFAVALATWLAVRANQAADAEQERARNASRHAAALLLLTQEYPRYFEPRVAVQWRERQAALAEELAHLPAELRSLQGAAARLPLLFERLIEVPEAPDTPFSQRRTDFLVDQLLNDTQGLADGIYRWLRDAAAEQQHAGVRFRWIVAASIAAVLALLVGQTVVIVRRLLRPLRRIEVAAAEVGRGDLTAKVGLASDDELGRLSRQFDAMTASLHERRAQVRAEIARREATERRLTDITDNIPALVGYFDADERLQFANGPALRMFRLAPDAVGTASMRDVLGDELYALHAPHLPALRTGQPVMVDATTPVKGRRQHFQANLVPDLDGAGVLQGFYAMTFDVTSLKEAEQRMSELARVDPLTGLPNRRQFEERLGEALARSRRSSRPLALMYLDIDHFKSINDTLGHQGGDVVLQTFSNRLRASVRGTDTVARLAGDEFVVVLEGLNVGPEAEAVAGKIIASMAAPMPVGERPVTVTTSIGIVVSGANPESSADLTARADDALYRAKRAGRNRFAVSVF